MRMITATMMMLLLLVIPVAIVSEPKTHKFYFDFGTETLDAQYERYQTKMDAVMKARGYQEGKNWITRKFPGAEHSEGAWRKRVDAPLRFLLGK